MASLKDLRDRIGSVKATQKITKAMQMVAAAKLRRAQEAVAAARPYCERLAAVLAAAGADLPETEKPELMRAPQADKTHLLVVCTSDRGLCGGFNVQIVREARAHIHALRKQGKQVKILAVGKKGSEMMGREFGALFTDAIDLSRYKTVGFEQAKAVADDILLRFEQKQFDVCTLFYSEFKSVISQEPRARQLVPCGQAEPNEQGGQAEKAQSAEKAQPAVVYEFEPDAAEILPDLAQRALTAEIFRALLENAAGEMGAKMTAMDNATRNAGTMIDSLSVTYNRRRQARITTELIEIIAGAEAL